MSIHNRQRFNLLQLIFEQKPCFLEPSKLETPYNDTTKISISKARVFEKKI